ncbi:MAG: methionyl-tRNA formyltransferase [Aridibacter sp.]
MKIVFMGTPNAAVPTLERILKDGHEVVAVWTQPDRPAGRGRKLTASPVKEFALENDLEVFQPEKIKTKESIELFKSHKADVAVVVAYGRILSKSYLKAFPIGCINVHFSLLPKYRGAAPVNWAIAGGETKTGITTMQMDSGLDTGDILLQSETEIGEQENSIELMERLSLNGAELLSETLKKYKEISPIKQNDAEASFAPILSKENGLIDWSLSAKEIHNRVRGFQPFPSSYTFYQDKKITIWRAKVWITDAENSSNDKDFGKIIIADKKDLFVNCGKDTILQILELQMQGKRRMETRDFLNGIQINTGEKLG